MPAKIFSAAILNLDAQPIEVEVASSRGLRFFEIVGLPDKAVEESKERVASAIRNSGFLSPLQSRLRILVNLAPADLKKEGSFYDLAIALGFLLETKQIYFDSQGKIFIGELALDGRLRPVKGVLAISLLAKQRGYKEIILPKENIFEANLACLGSQKEDTLKIIGVNNLEEAIKYLQGQKQVVLPPISWTDYIKESEVSIDFSWIRGQEHAKRALEIAAAGSHHLFMVGPPGGGKTILAKAIVSILPKLSFEESLEVTKIYSIAGLLNPEKPLLNSRPFRAPHHTASEVALIGGGNPPRPGEITLAHRGVLFLDEFPEFHRDVLESLRQPIEQGEITVLRARQIMQLPSRFMLLGASNPCPCGFKDDPQHECRCFPSQVAKYQRKLSGPLIDRIDIFIEVPQVKYEKLTGKEEGEESVGVQKRVEKAREIQKQRFSKIIRAKKKILTNSEMEIPEIKKFCELDSQTENLLRKYVDSGRLSARGFHRVLKMARTIADLDKSAKILFRHASEALGYRVKEDS
jgi:magnesium chelatase family protein